MRKGHREDKDKIQPQGFFKIKLVVVQKEKDKMK
jgi:hypothetical protein